MTNGSVAGNIDDLMRELRAAGLSSDVINAAWPSWWSDDLASDPSGRAELRFALARRLGLSAKSLLGERVEFVWRDDTRFKHLSAEDAVQQAALTSFGMSVGRLLLNAAPATTDLNDVDVDRLRSAVLATRPFVDLPGLLAICWAVGIPVIHLRVFPLEAKSMHAMVVRVEGRFAILLGRDASYPAPVAFTLAHELGHVLLGHLSEASALVDLEDPAFAKDPDEQEKEADCFALALLTGQSAPQIETSLSNFNAPTLANAAMKEGPRYGIEPGTLALVLAHTRGAWPVAMSALKFIYDAPRPVWREVNGLADLELAWDEIGEDAAEYLRNIMGAGG